MSTAVSLQTEMPRLERADGVARVAFALRRIGEREETRLADLFQDGSAKVRLPKVYDGSGPAAVFLNSAGGVTGGDHLSFEACFGAGTTATVTTQAAERIYRRADGVGHIDNRLIVEAGATAHWLPQETIVFDGAGLRRRLDVDLAGDARLVAAESIVLGRTAMGEEVTSVDLADHWRVRRGGRLIYADALRLSGDSRATLSGGATGRGARAFASVLVATSDAASRLDGARELIAALTVDGIEAGASAFEGLMSIRCLALDGRLLRTIVEPLIETLTGRPLPRAWSI
ncbi:Urease accessory protein UreD [Pleomorphomonas sp. T1.2MG-36]|uniref:urease accessory protein UreD n=1 Tax=Pleomorphomonas sp. T1.2MG-36 TaxID=3041167 RepID=UPI002477C4EC|nr:urease accessory protein UreD [Pleomorphomonas sp. T1.2MG-36]CAI9414068.1 Urease accessory protein UreD [Pleomorphomonas sp. T1.2MG-36]